VECAILHIADRQIILLQESLFLVSSAANVTNDFFRRLFTGHGFLYHLRCLRATMSEKTSVPQLKNCPTGADPGQSDS